MGPDPLNKKGYTKSLVPAHPGNVNAVKTGVFSPRSLAGRASEVAGELAAQRPAEMLEEVLRREIAALIVLRDAMDASLGQEGIRGRNGEPRTLIDRRLRLNDRLRRTLEQYLTVEHYLESAEQSSIAGGNVEHAAGIDEIETLIETVARFHFRDSIAVITPSEFDPERFLRALVLTMDPKITIDERAQAQRFLIGRTHQRADRCTCSATLVARDELEFRDWIDDARAAGVKPGKNDAYLACLVRRVAAGDRLEPWFTHQRTWYAIHEAIEAGADRVQGDGRQSHDHATKENDPAIAKFWKTLLDPSSRVTPRQRLKAFSVLQEAGALPQCTCRKTAEELIEDRQDAARAYVIRIVGQRYYRSAMIIPCFPETYHAVRDAIDAKVASVSASEEEQTASEAGG
jgi:hypothetical protein